MLDSTRVCYRTRSTSVCLSQNAIRCEYKLNQHSETNNSDIANKSRDAFFKEDVKQGDVSVVNCTTFYSKYISFLIKSHKFATYIDEVTQ